MSQQNDLAFVKDQLQQGKITLAQANVKLVQLEGVRLIKGTTPRDVRKALNTAVKAGELGHIKKDGLRPEAYHHINARSKALDLRDKEFSRAIAGIKAICI